MCSSLHNACGKAELYTLRIGVSSICKDRVHYIYVNFFVVLIAFRERENLSNQSSKKVP